MTSNSIFHIRESRSANRMELLDFLRGTAMILVLLHHSELPDPWGQWILSFHMPLMFLLSGYTMHLRPHWGCFKDFLRNRFLRLAVPYFLFEGLNLFIWSASLYLQGGWQDVTEAVTAVLACLNTEGYTGYYGRLWFWPCMFVSDIYFFWILKAAPDGKYSRPAYLCLVIPVTLVFSWFTCRMLPYRLPFAADTAFMATAFLVTGYLFGPLITRLLRHRYRFTDAFLLSASLAIMAFAILRGNAVCMMFVNQYGHFGYTLCAAYCGCLAFFILAKWLYEGLKATDLPKSVFLWYGYHSLATFPMHLSVKAFIYQMFPLHYRQWYIFLPAMFLINIPLVNLITKHFPFLLGKLPVFPQKQKTS